MALADTAVTVADAASGVEHALWTKGSKVHPVSVLAGPDGHILGSKDLHIYALPSQVHVAVANTIHWDLFNADAAKLVRILAIKQLPNINTAVTGVAFDWQIFRTSAVGTGGTVITPWVPDTSLAAMDADVTLRSKPTGGATTSGSALLNYTIHSEETNAATQMLHMMMAGDVADILPACLRNPITGQHGILLRQNQGLKCVQVTNSAAGNTGWLLVVSIEG